MIRQTSPQYFEKSGGAVTKTIKYIMDSSATVYISHIMYYNILTFLYAYLGTNYWQWYTILLYSPSTIRHENNNITACHRMWYSIYELWWHKYIDTFIISIGRFSTLNKTTHRQWRYFYAIVCISILFLVVFPHCHPVFVQEAL